MIKVVLFDLDGTLLPMDQEVFVKTYLGLLAKKLAPHGYDPQKLVDAIWAGTGAMIKNDGAALNEEVFWTRFCEIFGEDSRKDEPIFAEFYENEFQTVQPVCGFAPKAAEVIAKVKACGFRAALATNPVFPAMATESRIRWAGLDRSDFELVTTYENSRHSKPNLDYYRDIMAALGVEPQECAMVGNDVDEDMIAAQLGMKVFLLTDCVINRRDTDISAFEHGGFDELLEFIGSLI